jgi:hypothetical protein
MGAGFKGYKVVTVLLCFLKTEKKQGNGPKIVIRSISLKTTHRVL